MIHGNRLMKRSGLHPKSHCKTASYRILINNNNNGDTRGTRHTNGAEEELAQDLETVEEYTDAMNENNSRVSVIYQALFSQDLRLRYALFMLSSEVDSIFR